MASAFTRVVSMREAKAKGASVVTTCFPPSRHQLVPSLAATDDNVVVAFEAAVREPVVPRKSPDIFDRIQSGRSGRQRRDTDVGGRDEAAGEMPSRLIENEDRVSVGATMALILIRCACMALVSHQGMTSPAPFPSAGRIAPKIYAQFVRWS
jgi:hypothetical protein